MTETALDLPGIIIKGNQLALLNDSLSFYRLKVTVSQDFGPSGSAAYQFRMNAPPTPGDCTVTPTNGKALKTEFEFKCTNWEVRMIYFSLVMGLQRNLIPSFTAVLRDKPVTQATFLSACVTLRKHSLLVFAEYSPVFRCLTSLMKMGVVEFLSHRARPKSLP